jgi:sterol desaturase/sphingolipid hydroxylase (fatty acid hydroxylase superfamily)
MKASRFIRGGLVLAAGCAVLLLERRRPARAYVEAVAVHTSRNLVIAGIAAATVQAVEAPVVMPLARTVARRRGGLTGAIRPLWLRDVVAVLLLDYTLYLWHSLVHRVPWLWRFHLVHHVDLDLDASTGLRFHAGELAASVPWRAAQIVAIGVSPRALTAWQSLTIASVLFHHSNARLSAQAEGLLSWIIATPRMHAIHHSIDPDQLQTNFSSGLALWDRLHGTFRLDSEPQDVVVGVLGHRDPDDASFEKVWKLPFSDRAAVTRPDGPPGHAGGT